MKIAHQDSQGNTVLTKSPETPVKTHAASPLSIETFGKFLRFNNLPLPDLRGHIIYQTIDLTVKPVFVNDHEDYMRLISTCDRDHREFEGYVERAVDSFNQWMGYILPRGYMPASAVTLYSIAQGLNDLYIDKRSISPESVFPERVWKPGILTYSFVSEDKHGNPDAVSHQDLLIFGPGELPGRFLERLAPGTDGYIQQSDPSFPTCSQVLFGDQERSNLKTGCAFGFEPRICVLAHTRPHEGCAIRIEKAEQPKNKSESGWVYGVRLAGGSK